jgi:hypothetical protein
MLSKALIRGQNYVGLGLYGDGAANHPAPLLVGDAAYNFGNLQVSIVGTSATVIVYGRTAPTMPWFVLATITVSGVTQVALVCEMYAAVTAISAATVEVAVNYTNDIDDG